MMVDIDNARPALQAVFDAMEEVTKGSEALTVMASQIPDDGATDWMSKKIKADALSLQYRWYELVEAIGLAGGTVDFLKKT